MHKIGLTKDLKFYVTERETLETQDWESPVFPEPLKYRQYMQMCGFILPIVSGVTLKGYE